MIIETSIRTSEYAISTVNDSRFVSSKEIIEVLREQELSMCQPDSCTIDYSNCGLTADSCTIDYA
jgi:hypothetical protein